VQISFGYGRRYSVTQPLLCILLHGPLCVKYTWWQCCDN